MSKPIILDKPLFEIHESPNLKKALKITNKICELSPVERQIMKEYIEDKIIYSSSLKKYK